MTTIRITYSIRLSVSQTPSAAANCGVGEVVPGRGGSSA
jgi:hypothetical protein